MRPEVLGDPLVPKVEVVPFALIGFDGDAGTTKRTGETMRALGAVFLLLWTSCAHANEALFGNWKLVSFYQEDTQTKERNYFLGENPTGYIGFTPAGRFFVFGTADGRKPGQTPEAQAANYRSMVGYTGKWKIEGDKFTTTVDAAWNPAWVGTEQVRFWRIEGNRLSIISAPLPNPNAPGRASISYVIWEKE